MSHDFTHLVSMSKESESKLRISWSLTGHKRGAFLNKKRLPVKKCTKLKTRRSSKTTSSIGLLRDGQKRSQR